MVGRDPNAPRRPVLRYHGGKFRLADWLLEHFPPHHVYVEPFGGAASVLMQKERSYGEVYNDLDGDVVNVFRVLRDPYTAGELRRRLELTPYSRVELKAAYEEPVDKIDRAHKAIVRAFMGFGSASSTRAHMTGFRSNANRQGTTPSNDWTTWPEQIPLFTQRLMGVVIEDRAAVDVMRQHDEARALHYVDPPYPTGTRSSLRNRNGNVGHYYNHDMDDRDHRELAKVVHKLKGMVIVSGYRCELYDDELFKGWTRYETNHMADGARPRVECIWLNDHAQAALERSRAQRPLFLDAVTA